MQQTSNIDIWRTFTHKPKAALLNNGGHEDIHEEILQEADLIPNVHYEAVPLGAASIPIDACFTFISEAHADENDVSLADVNAVRAYVRNGGNFLAQCAGGRAYENTSDPSRRLITTNGADSPGIGGTILYDNADQPFLQIHNDLEDEGGSGPSFETATFRMGADIYRHAYDSNNGVNYKAYGGRIDGFTATKGGYVHYLGGHQYELKDIEGQNGFRMYLNAFLMPSDRPLACGINFNTVPNADDDTESVIEDQFLVVDVLNNDDFGADGPSNSAITIVSTPSNGSATVDENSTPNDPTDDRVNYLPNTGYTGADSFVYRICDIDGDCDTATVNITVQPMATLDFLDDSITVNEADGSITFRLRLSGSVPGGFSVDYTTNDSSAFAGQDYTTTSNTLNFNGINGQVIDITVPIIDDFIIESSETFFIDLSGLSSNLVKIVDNQAVGTITDNDGSAPGEGISVADFTVDEASGTADFVITYTGATVANSFTVDFVVADGTAVDPDDYTVATVGTQVTFPANTVDGTTQVVTVNIVDDAHYRKPRKTLDIGYPIEHLQRCHRPSGR